MIKKTDKVKFVMPDSIFNTLKYRNAAASQTVEGVAVSDEYIKEGKKFVRVNINGKVTTLAVDNLEVI
jgi:hypothetical protein